MGVRSVATAHLRCICADEAAARVQKITRTPDADTYTLTLEGLARIRLPRSLPPVLSILPPIPLTVSTFSVPLPSLHSPTATDLLPYASKLLPPQLHSKLEVLPPGILADLLATILGFEWETRVELLSIVDVDTRTVKVLEVILEMMSNRGISPPDTPAQPTKGQDVPSRALVRRPQLRIVTSGIRPNSPQNTPAPNAQVPEDLQPLHALLQKRLPELTASARSTLERELARLNKIPPQSAEYGVSKTYCEWLLALPWKKVTEAEGQIDLDEARRKLEDEHEGLEGVKRRVVEYLAVYRLKKQLHEEAQHKAIAGSAHPDGNFDGAAADDLFELVSPAQKRELERAEAAEQEAEEGSAPAFSDKGPILLLVGPPGVGKT